MTTGDEGWGIRDLIGLVAVVAFIFAVFYLFPEDDVDDDAPGEVCAGIGMEGPQAASPEAAFDGWLAVHPDEPPRDAWEMAPPRDHPASGTRIVGFTTEASQGWWGVSVTSGGRGERTDTSTDIGGGDAGGEPLGLDDWYVSGGCARMPDT